MSLTHKDSKQGTIIELIQGQNGTFDLFRNHELEREGIHEEGLVNVLCVRFGYCGEEYDAMLHKLKQNG